MGIYILALNKVLVYRDASLHQSNKNIIVRPGAREFLEELHRERHRIVFYSTMNWGNALACIKKLLTGTNISVHDVYIFDISRLSFRIDGKKLILDNDFSEQIVQKIKCEEEIASEKVFLINCYEETTSYKFIHVPEFTSKESPSFPTFPISLSSPT
jgi:hypothetical protein